MTNTTNILTNILGIDGSTDKTGLALIGFDTLGRPRHLESAEIAGKTECKGDTIEARLDRIRHIRWDLEMYVREWGERHGIDAVAYEMSFWRGQAASEAGPQASGAYLTIPEFAGLRVYPVMTMSVKSVMGAARAMTTKVVSRADQAAKRTALKRQAILWANAMFALGLEEDGDAIADACAVSICGFNLRREEQRNAAARPMMGPGSRPRKAKASA